ncbi:hypothetical protein KQY27_06860 [Methanobrevibacter sp. TMH8]|uniref:hypothetical protein n=1 Tax=Methanobrevibacter sp. TMH8 TaxID=2848611 RepID=UPI001CCE74DA|nr:hypothetical protein [Methanobrevibacter sp. TMH8]MBZ9571261.1 hypothetical protein [Methanobrevibacter sp. TMH8]
MNKKIIFLIIIILLLIGGIGIYSMIYNNTNSSENNFMLTNKSSENDYNMSLNESETNNNSAHNSNNIVTNKNSKNSNDNNKFSDSKIKTITSKSDVIKEANKILDSNREFYGKNAVVKNVKYNGNGLWFVDFIDPKNGKILGGTIISDKTGKMADAV